MELKKTVMNKQPYRAKSCLLVGLFLFIVCGSTSAQALVGEQNDQRKSNLRDLICAICISVNADVDNEDTLIAVPVTGFFSNRPYAQIKKLVFEADVSQKVATAKAVFSRARMVDTPGLKILSVTGKDISEIKIASQKLTSNSGLDDARLVDAVEAVLEIENTFGLGSREIGDLKFTWETKNIPPVSVPAVISVKHILAVTPSNLFLSSKAAERFKARLTLKGTSRALDMLIGVEFSDSLESIGLDFEVIKEAKKTVIEITGTAPDASRITGSVNCKFSGGVADLKIPMKILIKPK